LDVSTDKIAVAILRWEEQVPDTELIFHDEASVRRLIDRFPDRAGLRVCYEAGPTGFGLYRLLTSMKVSCEVIAPALIPRSASLDVGVACGTIVDRLEQASSVIRFEGAASLDGDAVASCATTASRIVLVARQTGRRSGP
jgi:hypothetical protein